MKWLSHHQGIIFALIAYTIWGIAPVYFKTIEQVPVGEILAHRILWSFVFLFILITFSRNWSHITLLWRQKRKLLLLGISGSTIACNWLLFIWAINNDHMLEASLGYFINPLFNILLGMLFLGERFRPLQWFAVLLAFVGVGVQLWQFGSLPIVALGLAITFGVYGLIRKKINVDVQTGLFIETFWLLPFASIYLFFIANSATSHLTHNSLSLDLLLMSAGVITTVPLLFFTAAAARLRLSTLGLFQYLGPTIMFILAVVVYHEPFGKDKLITFAFIWVALLIFTLDALHNQRRLRLR